MRKSLLVFSLAILVTGWGFTVGASRSLSEDQQTQSEVLPRIPLERKKDVRLVLHSNVATSKNGRNKTLWYADYIMDHYARLGVPKEEIKFSVVMYGDAIASLMKPKPADPAKPKKGHNPNTQLIAKLIEKGVSLEACSETMRLRNWTPDMLLPGVRTVEGGYVRVIDLQLAGYGYIKFL